MAWIRTVKPKLFRHEGLYELEQTSKLPVRLAFIALFTCCDREGRFEWKPRELKLDAMPWDRVEFEAVLDALLSGGFIEKYEVAGKHYGCIPTWLAHQVVPTKEAKSRLPAPRHNGITEEHPGSSHGIHGVEGKGRERKGKEEEGKRKGSGEGEGTADEIALLDAQRALERARLRKGLNADGSERGDWNEAKA